VESNLACNRTSDNKMGVRLLITSVIADRIGRHEVLLPVNHKSYDFREMNSQVMKERENSHENTYKGDVNILRPSHLLMAIRRQKHKSKHARART